MTETLDETLLNGEDDDLDYDFDYEKEEALLLEDEDVEKGSDKMDDTEEDTHESKLDKSVDNNRGNRREGKFSTERKLITAPITSPQNIPDSLDNIPVDIDYKNNFRGKRQNQRGRNKNGFNNRPNFQPRPNFRRNNPNFNAFNNNNNNAFNNNQTFNKPINNFTPRNRTVHVNPRFAGVPLQLPWQQQEQNVPQNNQYSQPWPSQPPYQEYSNVQQTTNHLIPNQQAGPPLNQMPPNDQFVPVNQMPPHSQHAVSHNQMIPQQNQVFHNNQIGVPPQQHHALPPEHQILSQNQQMGPPPNYQHNQFGPPPLLNFQQPPQNYYNPQFNNYQQPPTFQPPLQQPQPVDLQNPFPQWEEPYQTSTSAASDQYTAPQQIQVPNPSIPVHQRLGEKQFIHHNQQQQQSQHFVNQPPPKYGPSNPQEFFFQPPQLQPQINNQFQQQPSQHIQQPPHQQQFHGGGQQFRNNFKNKQQFVKRKNLGNKNFGEQKRLKQGEEFNGNINKPTNESNNQLLPDEDEETRNYRLKIEEQKRRREEILRQKEERRKMAAGQVQENTKSEVSNNIVVLPTQSNNNIVIQQNRPPQQVQRKRLVQPQPVQRTVLQPNLKNISPVKVIQNQRIVQTKNNITVANQQPNRKVFVKNNRNPPPAATNINLKCINTVDIDMTADKKHLSSFLADRKILAKDQNLIETRSVLIKNLSTGTTQNKLMSLCRGVGPIQKLLMEKPERQATITFKSVASAHTFYKKYQRHMIDLSMIEVSLLPMTD